MRLLILTNFDEGIVSYIAMSFVMVSTVVMALNTIQGLKVMIIFITFPFDFLFSRDKVMNDKGVLLPHPFLEIIEAICIAWFTLEYIVR